MAGCPLASKGAVLATMLRALVTYSSREQSADGIAVARKRIVGNEHEIVGIENRIISLPERTAQILRLRVISAVVISPRVLRLCSWLVACPGSSGRNLSHSSMYGFTSSFHSASE